MHNCSCNTLTQHTVNKPSSSQAAAKEVTQSLTAKASRLKNHLYWWWVYHGFNRTSRSSPRAVGREVTKTDPSPSPRYPGVRDRVSEASGTQNIRSLVTAKPGLTGWGLQTGHLGAVLSPSGPRCT